MGAKKISAKKFYFGERILPDHVLYPAVMLVDRGLLVVASGESEIFLRIRLAQDRMIRAQKLLEKGEESLALSTLTKSQKYLILAVQEFMSDTEYSHEVGLALYTALQENTQNLIDAENNFKVVPTDPIGDLVTESQTLLVSVNNKIRK